MRKILTRKPPSETNCCATEAMVEELELMLFALVFMVVVGQVSFASSRGNAWL